MDPKFPPTPEASNISNLGQSDARSWGGQAAALVLAGAATLSLTRELHAGRTVAADQATGTAFSLPAAVGSGDRYRIMVRVASNANTILCAPNTDDFNGGVLINDTGDTSAATADFFPAAATPNTMTLTTAGGGGFVGDWVVFTDILAGEWQVFGVFRGASDPVTPFS